MSEKLEQFLKGLKKKSTPSYNTNITRYLKWRSIDVDQLVASGLNEDEHFQKFLSDSKVALKETSKKTIVSMVKTFMIFLGVPFKKHYYKKQPLAFEDDIVMKRFLRKVGESEGTKRNANRQIAKYCKFRNMNPSELIEETKNISEEEVEDYIHDFADTINAKTKYYTISTLLRFYRLIGRIHIELPNLTRKNGKKLMLTGKTLVDKNLIRKLLEVADLRDSMVIMTCFESGMNGVDMVSLNYSDLKPFLNISNPNDVNDVAVIVHTRTKTNVEFLACFGKQSLRLISKWLQIVSATLDKEIKDDMPIFTQKEFPFQRLSNKTISNILTRLCNYNNLGFHVTTADFRNSFNTRAKKMLKHYDKELMMGHVGGIERAYDISDLEYFNEEYRKACGILFDLTYDYEKFEDLESELLRLGNRNRELEQTLLGLKEQYDPVIEDLIKKMEEQTKLIQELQQNQFDQYQQEEAEMAQEWDDEKKRIKEEED